MNEQRLINEAWAHLSKTKLKSMPAGGEPSECLYAGSGCAFMPAIKKDYIYECEGKSAFSLINDYPKFLKKWAVGLNVFFANYVQAAHDNCLHHEGEEFVKEFAGSLNLLILSYKEKFNLEVPETMQAYL